MHRKYSSTFTGAYGIRKCIDGFVFDLRTIRILCSVFHFADENIFILYVTVQLFLPLNSFILKFLHVFDRTRSGILYRQAHNVIRLLLSDFMALLLYTQAYKSLRTCYKRAIFIRTKFSAFCTTKCKCCFIILLYILSNVMLSYVMLCLNKNAPFIICIMNFVDNCTHHK